jgi:acyl-homoserine lactone acylase PvdQ
MRYFLSVLAVFLASHGVNASCVSSGDQNTINSAFSAGGQGHIVQLCAGVTITITGTIQFTANGQEISTQGYPTGSTRATIQIATGNKISTLISGAGYSGIRILNLQVDGNRPNAGYVHNGMCP